MPHVTGLQRNQMMMFSLSAIKKYIFLTVNYRLPKRFKIICKRLFSTFFFWKTSFCTTCPARRETPVRERAKIKNAENK